MKRLSYVLIVMIFAAFLYVSAKAQEATSTPPPFPPLAPFGPTPTTDPNDNTYDLFPVNLHCEQIKGFSNGPTWGEITIGVSNVGELKNYVSTINDYDVWQAEGNIIRFFKKHEPLHQDGVPTLIGACFDPTSRIVTALITSLNRPLFIHDLVAQYGTPDVVTWGFGFRNRTGIWFEEGIAAVVYIFDEHKVLGFGQIDFIVYFPYQPKDGFEERWPYNKTSLDNPLRGSPYEATASKEQNPFDFQAMIATITAEPSRTPTPTFVPYTPVATATP